MDSSKLKVILILTVSAFLAVYLGVSAATDQFQTIAWVLAVLVLIACFSLGKKIWLLIPFTAATAIGFRLPGQPDTLLLGQILFLAFCTPLFLLRKLPFQLRFTEIEWLMVLLSAFVLQVYIRNPVGLNVTGSENVGGKAYAIYAISLVTALILCGFRVPESDLKWMRHLTILGGLINLVVSIVGALIPTIGYYTGATFNRTDEVNYENAGKAVDTGAATRMQFLGKFGHNLVIWTCAFRSPIRSLFHPFWLLILLLAAATCMLSGYRSSVIAASSMLLIGIAYRDGIIGIIISAMGATLGIVLLALVNAAFPLPPNVQRSLSFLPGSWDSRYVQDGKDSTDWRVDIWKEVLLTDRWIENKWVGDGLGFSMKELAYQMNIKGAQQRRGMSGFDLQREGILASGDYHSGPVQTIRIIGYAGLAALILFQIRLAILAHRQIRRTRGTEWFPLALIVGIPIIWAPFQFIVVFGTFKDGAAALLLGAAMVRILQNNLPLPSYDTMIHSPRTLPLPRH